jgi:hypothetical protein
VVLTGIGFDRTGLVLVTDPVVEVAVIELTAPGKGAGSARQTC